jgi:hypothetical protein
MEVHPGVTSPDRRSADNSLAACLAACAGPVTGEHSEGQPQELAGRSQKATDSGVNISKMRVQSL